jgi:CPA2 family monovalent cation:H+ antiporter-2
VREANYEFTNGSGEEHRRLDQLIRAVRGTEISWVPLEQDSPLVNRSLSDVNLRARTGASIVAMVRQEQVMPNPSPRTRFEPGDMLGLIGEREQLEAAATALAGKGNGS